MHNALNIVQRAHDKSRRFSRRLRRSPLFSTVVTIAKVASAAELGLKVWAWI